MAQSIQDSRDVKSKATCNQSTDKSCISSDEPSCKISPPHSPLSIRPFQSVLNHTYTHSLTHSLACCPEKFVVVVVTAAAFAATILVKSRAPPCVLKTLGAALVGRWVGLFLM